MYEIYFFQYELCVGVGVFFPLAYNLNGFLNGPIPDNIGLCLITIKVRN